MNSNSKTQIFALGGLGEVGKNMYCLEHDDQILIIDCGVKFPDAHLLGVDCIIPDFTYLKENEHKIKALIVTHGHEDHIGGIPFLLKQIRVPKIISSEITMGFINNKIKDKKIKNIKMQTVNSDEIVNFNDIEVSFFRVIHSIPGSFGISMKTRDGRFVYTGDFKIDPTPLGNEKMEVEKILELSKKGITLMLSDSTSSEHKKSMISERKIADNLGDIISKIKGRIIVSTFASNIDRVKSIIEKSIENNRKIAIFGRSMERGVQVAKKSKYIDLKNSDLLKNDQIKNYNPENITILCTGSQGEELAALSRMSQDLHNYIKLNQNDTIIFSSSPIPGNTIHINRLISKLLRKGVNVITHSEENIIHASGHGSSEELKNMISMMMPKYFMPVHGEYKMQIAHSKIAIDTNVKKENIFICKNGDRLTFSNQKFIKKDQIKAGVSLVDGERISFDGDIKLIEERKIMSEDGLLVISAVLNKKTKKIIKKPYILIKGFINLKENEHIIRKLENELTYFLSNNTNKENIEKELIKKTANIIFKNTKRQPMIFPAISYL